MLFFEYRPIAVFVAVICPRDGRALTVRRGEYTGFPGGIVPEHRSIDEFALGLVRPIALCKGGRLDLRHVLVSRSEGQWDGKPVAVQIVALPRHSFEPIQGLGAEWTDLDDPLVRFDVFVEEFKRARSSCPILAFPPVAEVA